MKHPTLQYSNTASASEETSYEIPHVPRPEKSYFERIIESGTELKNAIESHAALAEKVIENPEPYLRTLQTASSIVAKSAANKILSSDQYKYIEELKKEVDKQLDKIPNAEEVINKVPLLKKMKKGAEVVAPIIINQIEKRTPKIVKDVLKTSQRAVQNAVSKIMRNRYIRGAGKYILSWSEIFNSLTSPMYRVLSNIFAELGDRQYRLLEKIKHSFSFLKIFSKAQVHKESARENEFTKSLYSLSLSLNDFLQTADSKRFLSKRITEEEGTDGITLVQPDVVRKELLRNIRRPVFDPFPSFENRMIDLRNRLKKSNNSS